MSTRFEYPQDVAFACTRCGDCCRSGNVVLGPGEVERLRALDWRGKEAELETAAVIVSSALPGGRRVQRLARREDGACIYLGADNLCNIHRYFDGEAKPLVCRLFPFGFSPIAGGVTVDCSFSCRSISEGSGDPLAQRVPEWTALLSEAGNLQEGRHRLNRQRTLSGEVLWEIEHYLLGFLANQTLPLFDRIRCCLQFIRLGTTGDPATPSASKLREAIARGLPKQIAGISRGGGMDRTQRVAFYQWLFLALNPSPVNADLRSGVARNHDDQRRIAAAQRFASQQGKPVVDNRELASTWEQIRAVDATVVMVDNSRLLEHYLAAKIIGQRFLLVGGQEAPLIEALPLFLLTYPMSIWTAGAVAAERGAAAVSESDLRHALVVLDRTLGQVSLSGLPSKSADAWHFVIEETDIVVHTTNELLGLNDDVNA